MRRYLIYIVAFVTIFTMTSKVKAASLCDNRTLADYRELAGNVQIYTDYRIEENQALFDITITNLPMNVTVEDVLNGNTYSYADFTTETELVIKDFTENQRLTFNIYMNVGGCYGQLLATKYVTLPNYNEYSSDDACLDIPEFSLCQRWGAVSTGYSTFLQKAEEYKIKKNQEKPPRYVPAEKTTKDKILDFINKYYIYIIGGIAVIVLLLMGLKTYASDKNEFDFKV